jgi:hypothetical protein
VILGTYEKELWPVFDSLHGRAFSHILIPGAGVGYYVVGCAQFWPSAKIVCWEVDPRVLPAQGRLIDANALGSRVDIRGFCDREQLDEFSGVLGASLIICDIDGPEADLLDLQRSPGLRSATMIVEHHANVADNCRELLEQRFAATHRIARYWPRQRSLSDFPFDKIRVPKYLRGAAAAAVIERPTWSEGHHGWLFLDPIESESAQRERA